MKKQLTTASVVACLLLAGCSSNAPANVPANNSTAAAPATTAADSNEMTKKFGSTFKWDNGVEFTLSQPKVTAMTENMKMLLQNKKLNEVVVMDATLVNGTKEPLSPMMVHAQATSGDGEAEAVFDSGADIGLPTADILPGKTAKFKVAFARTKGQEFIVQVSNNSDFTSKKGYYK